MLCKGLSTCGTAEYLPSLPLTLIPLHLWSKGTNGILGSKLVKYFKSVLPRPDSLKGSIWDLAADELYISKHVKKKLSKAFVWGEDISLGGFLVAFFKYLFNWRVTVLFSTYKLTFLLILFHDFSANHKNYSRKFSVENHFNFVMHLFQQSQWPLS